MMLSKLKETCDPFLELIERVTIQGDEGLSPIIKAPLVFGGIFGLSYVGLTLWNNWYREKLEMKREKILTELQEKFKYHDHLEETAKFKEEYRQMRENTETIISQITLKRDVRISFASQIMSMSHAVSVIGLSAYALWTEPHWNDVNTSLQNKIAMWSLGYFVFDTLNVMIRDFSWEFLFHHVCSIGYWLSCYYLNRGGYYGMLAGFVGEITNPVQIIWTFAKKNQLTKLYNFLSPIFTFYFITIRCLVIPVLTVIMNYHMWYHSTAPVYWKCGWITSSWLMNFGSWMWCYMLWNGYMKFKKREQEKEKTKKLTGNGMTDGEEVETTRENKTIGNEEKNETVGNEEKNETVEDMADARFLEKFCW